MIWTKGGIVSPGVEIGVTISGTGSVESIVNSERFRGKL